VLFVNHKTERRIEMVKKLLGQNRVEALKQLKDLLGDLWYGVQTNESYLKNRVIVLEAKLGRRAKQYQKLQAQLDRLLNDATTSQNVIVEYSPEEYKDWTK
jgi:chaperonin cofactor prefoldin